MCVSIEPVLKGQVEFVFALPGHASTLLMTVSVEIFVLDDDNESGT